MTGEIPIEYLPAALAARLDCPVDDCAGTVRLTLASNAPGDVAVWRCDSAASHEWHEDGSPRWGVEFAVEVIVGDHEEEIDVCGCCVEPQHPCIDATSEPTYAEGFGRGDALRERWGDFEVVYVSVDDDLPTEIAHHFDTREGTA